MTEKESSSSNDEGGPPSPYAILIIYCVLGCLISFLTGREPGTLPENIPREMAPAVIVICGFLVSYSTFDVMTVGMSKKQTNYSTKRYQDLPSKLPEETYLASRVQTNQVEQMPVFIVGSLGCALFVNGTVAGICALMWTILRRRYASLYRSSVGVSVADMGLDKYTIPAYFLSNSMVMATAVQALRSLLFV